MIYDKHWHGRNRQKDETLTEAERIETAKCILCQAQDSQEHTLQCCPDSTIAALREAIMTNLKKDVHQYDASSALHRQIGRALLDVLATTTEPGRIWLGNLGLGIGYTSLSLAFLLLLVTRLSACCVHASVCRKSFYISLPAWQVGLW